MKESASEAQTLEQQCGRCDKPRVAHHPRNSATLHPGDGEWCWRDGYVQFSPKVEAQREEEPRAEKGSFPLICSECAGPMELKMECVHCGCKTAVAADEPVNPSAVEMPEPLEWQSVPDSQGYWWHLLSEPDAKPFIYHVQVSMTGKPRYFIDYPDSGWCDEVGGLWMKIPEPQSPGEQALLWAEAARKEGGE